MKIGLKLSILIGSLSFIVALVLGNYVNSISSKEIEKKAGESLINLSKHVAKVLDREMLERYREIQFAATMPVLTDEKSTIEQKRAFIEKIKNNQKHHEWIGYALPSGKVLVGTNGYLEGKNAKARPWLPAGLKGPYIGDVHDALLLAKLLPNNSGESIYFTDVAFPVKNSKGEVLGVLCTHLMWQWTRDVIRSIQKENNVDIFLLSKSGMVLVGPKNSERQELSELSKNAYEAFKGEKTYAKIVDWRDGNKYLSAHTISEGFEEYKGFGWKVIVREPIDEAFKAARDTSNSILMMSIIAGLVGAVIGILLSNLVTSPLKRLHQNVLKLKSGEHISFESSSSKDEIGDLQNALKEYQEGLQKESMLKKEAEEKVKISLQVFDQSLEGILITDKNNNVILVNKSFTKITGYSQEDIYQKNPSILSSGKYPKSFYEEMWQTIVEKGKWDGELDNRRKDGTIYSEYLKISTLKNEKGEIVNYLGTFNSGF